MSSGEATWRNDSAETSATCAISGTSSTSASPVSVGSTPEPPVSVEEIVPPKENTATLGRAIAPPFPGATSLPMLSGTGARFNGTKPV